MTKKTKKKYRIKKKNFAIFIVIVIVSFILLERTFYLGKSILKKRNNIEEKNKETKRKKTNPKLDELENINEKITYFKESNIDRYINYKRNNQNLEIIQIIKNVNMDLDKKPYEEAKEITDKNNPLVLVNKYNYLGETFIPQNLETIQFEICFFKS